MVVCANLESSEQPTAARTLRKSNSRNSLPNRAASQSPECRDFLFWRVHRSYRDGKSVSPIFANALLTQKFPQVIPGKGFTKPHFACPTIGAFLLTLTEVLQNPIIEEIGTAVGRLLLGDCLPYPKIRPARTNPSSSETPRPERFATLLALAALSTPEALPQMSPSGLKPNSREQD